MHTLKFSLVFGLVILWHNFSWADESGDPNCLEKKTTSVRLQDKVWLLSCRSLSCPEYEQPIPGKKLTEGLVTWQYDLESQRWNEALFERLLKPAEQFETVIWVHGNLTTASEAFSSGLTVYKNLIRNAENQPPIRFIIWSWPASKVHNRPVPDARVKAARTTWAGLRLAGLVEQIPDNPSVSLVGFSFGAQVVAAALELLAGGELNQTKIKNPAIADSYRVTLFAAALDSYWLLPGRRFGNALNVTGHLTLINNDCDWILKHYGKLYCHCGRRGPSALGYTGLPVGNLAPEQKEKIKQFNVSSSLGKQHTLQAYLQSWSAMQRIREGVFQNQTPIRLKTTEELSMAGHPE